MPNRRRYPRIDFDGPAVLEVRREGAARSSAERALVPLDVIVTSISCEGAGFKSVGAFPMVLGNGKSVRLRMLGPKGEQLMLPASVRWTRDLGEGAVEVGLELHLSFADSASRQTYAYWVVEKSVEAERAAKATQQSATPGHSMVARGSNPRLRRRPAAQPTLPDGNDVVAGMRGRPRRADSSTSRPRSSTPATGGENVSVKVSREALRRALRRSKDPS